RDMGEPRRRFNPSMVWTITLGGLAAGAAHARRSDLADVAEQVLQEAAFAPESRSLVARGADPRDLFQPAAFGADHVAGVIEADCQHRMLGNPGGGERLLAGRARHVVPHRVTELA